MERQQSTAARVFNVIDFNVIDLEADIEAALRPSEPVREQQPQDYAPPAVRSPELPAYLEHRPGTDEVGKLSAEAVAKSYELAALEVEKMGEELKERARLCEAMVAESNQALALVQETAAQFRDAGKAIFLRIEDCSLLMREVRETCDALKTKIAGPSS